MDIKVHLKDKLSSMLFLEIDKNNLKKIFNTDLKGQIYLPIAASNIIDTVKAQKNMDKIPVQFFIEGMFYVLGADRDFKYNDSYIEILKNTPNSVKFIKGKIAKQVKDKKYEDAYILLKGLLNVEKTKEVYDKIIILVDYIRKTDSSYKSEELEILEDAESIDNYALPYFYDAIIQREDENYEKALFCINNYISRGGEKTMEALDFKESVKSVVEFNKAKEILNENPTEALKIMLPLMDVFGDHPSFYYYVAVAYRLLENYEKAIYYLNEALNIDSSIVEVINEMGINYACIGDYKTAISYLRKAFEATRSVEICTNLVMCYLNLNDMKSAREHFNIAKKLDPKDEVVIQLENIFK
ncbi:tetratricopeptide repeat protein [Clostridium sp. cel8]|jgi:tetratricopeptide (TPR) repeat protein|uniref:tetratricopeptide repeat protein n=1 Tax=Clostridium sp. cel8 TaxID=2663123 RepID=UPI0015F71966|nr:tetratricopeptide repeat protein [Clostridium sp. cel8]MBA5850894.1 tetratricopeptide repeat protein [Clostridium sp. cel8]